MIHSLIRRFEEGHEVGDEEFDALALEVHEAQRSANPVLDRFWSSDFAGTALASGSISQWHEIPPVPTSVFKSIALHPPGPVDVVFRTSGTTLGIGGRGAHHVVSMDLYRAASVGPMRAALLPPGAPRRHLLALVPNPAEVPESSLGHMVRFLSREEAVSGTTWAWDTGSGVVMERVAQALEADEPILLVTTAFALVALLDMAADGAFDGSAPFQGMPKNSAIMETGGFKGRTAVVSRGELYQRVEDQLGVPSTHVVNEYGMTELLSQAYDGVVGAALPISRRRLRFPSWVRTRVLDPRDLRELPFGEKGLLCHMDLANAGSACPILTEDLGVLDEEGGLVLFERASGAEPRGCSLMAEAFLRKNVSGT